MLTELELLTRISELETECTQHKSTIAFLEAKAHERNIQLDALHMVWCDGGCKGGTHRYTVGEITPEMVAFVECYAARLRTWFVNNAGKQSDSHAFHDYETVWEEARQKILAAKEYLENRS